MWGSCAAIKPEYGFRPSHERAHINDDFDPSRAELWTRFDFGCVAWASLQAALKEMGAG